MPDNALTSCRGFRNENCSWQQHACCRCSNNPVVGHASVSRRRRGCGSLRVGCFGAVFRVLSHALGAGEIHAQTGEGSQIATRDSSTGGSQGAELEFESGADRPERRSTPHSCWANDGTLAHDSALAKQRTRAGCCPCLRSPPRRSPPRRSSGYPTSRPDTWPIERRIQRGGQIR